MLVFLTDTREANCGQNTRHNGLLRIETPAELAADLQDRWVLSDELAAAIAVSVLAGARVSFTTSEPYLHFDVALSAVHPRSLPERLSPSVVEPLPPTPEEQPTW